MIDSSTQTVTKSWDKFNEHKYMELILDKTWIELSRHRFTDCLFICIVLYSLKERVVLQRSRILCVESTWSKFTVSQKDVTLLKMHKAITRL